MDAVKFHKEQTAPYGTTVSTEVPMNTSSDQNIIQRNPLISFFLLVFALTWPFLIVDALGSHGVFSFRLSFPLLILTGYMPTLAAVIVTGMTKGQAGIRTLFGKLMIARVGLRWYLFAIFGFGALCATAILLTNLSGVSPTLPLLSGDMPLSSNPLGFVLNILLLFVITGIVNGEELAWRGFALPKLQEKYSALESSLILGVIWTMFHLPLFFTLTGSSQAHESFVGFLIGTVSLTVIFTWMYNHTRGSVLLAYLLHAGTNTWTRVFSIDNGNAVEGWILTGLTVLLAVIVLITAGPRDLSRSEVRIQQ
jgi:membrane protease YdiL (CAAX protease family)